MKKNVRCILTGLALVLAFSLGLGGCPVDGGTNYTVTFDTQGGSTIAAQTVSAGSQVSKPDNPTRASFVFADWYTAATGGTVISWPLTVNSDITVYAGWNAEVSFGISLDQTGTHTFAAAFEGYGAQTAKTVTITNTGNQATGALAIALSGADSDSFTLSPTSISNIAVGGTDSFTVVPNPALVVGTYTATVTVSGGSVTAQSFDVSFTVDPQPDYGISLDQTETHTFTAVTIPYGAQTAKPVTINNVGLNATGALDIALSGANPGSFTLSSASVSTIAIGSNDSFTVVPNTALGAGTYTATVTVSGGNVTTQSFDVSFTVNPPEGTSTDAAAPSITVQPASSATYAQNVPATALTVTATVTDSGTLSYQWYKNTSSSTTGGTSLGSANGAQTASYTPVTSATGILYYYVVVTNTNSSATGTQTATATSSVAAVTVNALVNAATPSITGQPASSATYLQNATASALTVTATVTDGGTRSYQWYKNTSNSTTGGTSLGSANGAQTASYTPVTSAAGTLYYYVVVTNTNNSVSGTQTATATSFVATVTVNPIVNAATPSITGQPSSATYSRNATATALTVTATVTDGGTRSYQWYKNTSNNTTGGTSIASATSASYTPVTSAAGTLYYYVVVTNTNSSVNGTTTATATSSVATVTVNAPTGTSTVTVTLWLDEDIAFAPPPSEILSRSSSDTALITLSGGGYSNHQWSVNSIDVPGPAGTAATYTFDSAGKGNGQYNIGLQVQKDSIWYSTTITITVTN
ncbi:hypothetical protein FACS1894109_06090 [Spirochaetia bacterium]|nr:hypothetical protein FACS1894109_06090 [Spirochaetia bacterium]